jgi:phospholipid:diacylglycerol acyltransferase
MRKGSWTMLRAMLLDRKCWQSAVMLDPITGALTILDIVNIHLLVAGLDPPGFKLRAASGFEAADFFVTGISMAKESI